MIISGVCAAVVLAAFHILFPAFERRFEPYHKQWVGFSAGVSIGYVFAYLMPKISVFTQAIISEAQGPVLFPFRLYAVSLLGVITYVLHYRALLVSGGAAKMGITINATMICLYNLLIGLVVAGVTHSVVVMVGTLAFALHSLGMNHQIRALHPEPFDAFIRWLAALSVAAGWSLGVTIELPSFVIPYATAFLSGGIITNALSEELPVAEDARLLEFGLGMVLFCLITLYIRTLPLQAG